MTTFSDNKNTHPGQTLIICGCGASLNEFHNPQDFVTIGVNDVGRKFDPDYLVVVNPRSQFSGDRFQYVENSNARFLFSQLDLSPVRPQVVRFELGQQGGTELADANALPYTQNSPYVAVCLAIHMGARRIGLIGVDFTDGHFFGPTGQHPLAPSLEKINREYAALLASCQRRGIGLFNLSQQSRLTALPKLSLADFAAGAGVPKAGALRIVSYATTPVAGVPAILARCIQAKTPHQARCVWATDSYGNGVAFAGDIEWNARPAEAETALAEADVVIVHNGKVEERHRRLLQGKAVVTMAHNYLWNVDTGFVKQGLPGVVVGQYQATLAEFDGWGVMPNPLPLWEPAFQPANKPETLTIAYTPSGKHERYPSGHPLYWHGKGYDTTLRVLDRLANRHGIRVETVRDRQLSHVESLRAKQNAHIVIDECVTGSYHRNSLEGLALGCAVVNGVGLLAGVEDVFRRCALGGESPFVFASLETLEQTLTGLIETGHAELIATGQRNRKWMQGHWDFARQWDEFWQPAVEQALGQIRPKAISQPKPQPPQASPAKPAGLTAIVPQRGMERLPLLAACLVGLVQTAEVDQIIVVELGPKPLARRLCDRLGVEYVYGYAEGPFNKARAVNIGCGLARHDLLLWSDNDLLLQAGALAEALGEMRRSNYDLLFPFARIAYLSEADSLAVREGGSHPSECKPVNVYAAVQAAIGGVLLVREDFVRHYGGMCEAFQGWGGEDNSWVHKVQVLGRYGITAQRERTAYHLYHADSNGTGGTPGLLNPHYAQNVALMERIKALRSPHELLAQFPSPVHASLPWEAGLSIAFVVLPGHPLAALAQTWAEHLQRLYGVSVGWLENPQAAGVQASAWVVFGLAAASTLTDGFPLDKSLLVVDRPDSARQSELLQAWAVCLAETRKDILALSGQGCPIWHQAWAEADFAALVQALAWVLGQRRPQALPHSPELERCVWQYWEGPCPEWIGLCQATLKAHAKTLRLLDFAGFDALWKHDRDIDLKGLPVAHRADFVRAYVLAEYGGLWVDSDCVVMASLEPLLDQLQTCGFIAHRERQGFFSNAFMGAQAGSPVAQAFYEAVCAELRSGRALGWIALGNQPLTTVLRSTDAPWLELDCEQIQPVCWSRPEMFFQEATVEQHARQVNPRALCYMLSNQNVQQCQRRNPRQNLLHDGSFFRHLLARAMQPEAAAPPQSLLAPLTLAESLPWVLQTLVELAPERALDLGGRYGFWAALLLEACPCLHLEAIAADPASLGRFAGLYDSVSTAESLAEKIKEPWQLVLVDYLLDTPGRCGFSIERLLSATDYVLILTPLTVGPHSAEALPVVRQAVFQEQGYGVYLLSNRDPHALRQADGIESALDRLYQCHASHSIESIAGPGASISQTQRVREQLPLLLQNLEVQSLLELPCGDAHWTGQIQLNGIDYIGGDPVPWALEACRQRHERDGRKFLRLDPAMSPLPKVDLVLCRDFWVHLRFADITQVLANLRRSGSRYVLATTFTSRSTNVDVAVATWRPLNLERPPFNFPPPIRLIDEKCTESQGNFSDKSLGLWLLSDVC